MEARDTIYCRLRPRADLRRQNTSLHRLHPNTTYEAIGLGSLSLGSYGSLWDVRWDICGAVTTLERLAPIGILLVRYHFASLSAR
eukprot:5656640-Pyramimonas_sp.AAC.1